MVREPTIRLERNGAFILGEFLKKHLISASYVDSIDNEMDGLTLTFSAFVEPPQEGEKIRLFLGFDGVVEDMGEFYPFGVKEEYGDFTMTIKMTPIDFSKSIKEKRTHSYKGITFSSIIKKIAQRNKLESRVTIPTFTIQSKQQSNQSDLSFLRELCDTYNVTFAIKNNTIIVAPKSSKDKVLPHFEFGLEDMIDLEIEHNYKTHYNSAKGRFRDRRKNKDIEVEVGTGEPKLVLEGSYRDEADARAKIEAALKRENAGVVEGSFSTTSHVIAGATLTLLLPDKKEEDLLIKRVRHTIDRRGYIKYVQFTK